MIHALWDDLKKAHAQQKITGQIWPVAKNLGLAPSYCRCYFGVPILAGLLWGMVILPALDPAHLAVGLEVLCLQKVPACSVPTVAQMLNKSQA